MKDDTRDEELEDGMKNSDTASEKVPENVCTRKQFFPNLWKQNFHHTCVFLRFPTFFS